MNWYAAERERQFREAQAVAAGERRRMLLELKAMQAEQRRERRTKLMASVAALWQSLRRRKVGVADQSEAATGKIATGASH